MKTDLQISFFDCCDASQESTITVTGAGHSRYRYVARAARYLTRWITVTAEVCRIVMRTLRAVNRSHFRNTGMQLLHQSAILRI